MRRLYMLLALLLIFPCAAGAMPGMGSGDGQNAAQNQEERFKAMDKNADGLLSQQEFSERFPSMQDAALKSIDKNGDNTISLEEWMNFSNSHSRDMGASGMGRGPVMREMFREDGSAAPAEGPKGRPLFEMKQKDGAQ